MLARSPKKIATNPKPPVPVITRMWLNSGPETNFGGGRTGRGARAEISIERPSGCVGGPAAAPLFCTQTFRRALKAAASVPSSR